MLLFAPPAPDPPPHRAPCEGPRTSPSQRRKLILTRCLPLSHTPPRSPSRKSVLYADPLPSSCHIIAPSCHALPVSRCLVCTMPPQTTNTPCHAFLTVPFFSRCTACLTVPSLHHAVSNHQHAVPCLSYAPPPFRNAMPRRTCHPSRGS